MRCRNLATATSPQTRDRSVAEDDTSFGAVVVLLLRAWPYLKPQIFGRWFIPGEGVQAQQAETVSGSGYGFSYAPVLVTILALLWPFMDWIPAPPMFAGASEQASPDARDGARVAASDMTTAVPALGSGRATAGRDDRRSVETQLDTSLSLNLLYLGVIVMVLLTWPLPFTAGKTQTIAAAALFLVGFATNFIASFGVDGFADGVYVASITTVCTLGWMLQFRFKNGVGWRFRLHAHLVYLYSMIFAQRLLLLFVGLLAADILNQSVLQAEPLMPAVAGLLGFPDASANAVSELAAEQRHELKWVFIVINLCMMILVQLPFGLATAYYQTWILQRVNQDLRLALMARWHEVSLRYHSEHRVGDSIYRTYQDSAQVTAVLSSILEIINTLISYLTAIVLVAILSPLIGLLAALIIIPIIILTRWSMPRMRTRSLVSRATTSDLTSCIQETFSRIRLIKACAAEARELRHFEEDSVVSFNAQYRTHVLIALVSILMFTIAALFLLGGEFLMAFWASESRETYGTSLIALVGVSFVLWNLGAFQWTNQQFSSAAASVQGLVRQWLTVQDIAMGLRRSFDILAIKPEVQDRAEALAFSRLDDEIRFDHVGFSYESDHPILGDVSFSATPGTMTAIVGPTGSGKSTLMALLLRLYDPTSGTISIDGCELAGYEVESLRAGIAIALQQNVLFAMSVRDNIRYAAPDASADQVNEAIRVSCMEEYVTGLPKGLDTILGDRGGRISTGQQQRLSIARAIVRDTPILILDEPTAALDVRLNIRS